MQDFAFNCLLCMVQGLSPREVGIFSWNCLLLLVILLPDNKLYIGPNSNSADDNFKFNENSRKFFKWIENTVSEGAISPFVTVFSKGLFPRGVKRCHCVGMGYFVSQTPGTVFLLMHWKFVELFIPHRNCGSCRFEPTTIYKSSFEVKNFFVKLTVPVKTLAGILPKQALVITCVKCKSFENSVGKGEIAHNE